MKSDSVVGSKLEEDAYLSVHYSRLAAREIGVRENGLADFLRGTGISPEAFMADDLLLTTEQQTRIALNAMALSGDQGLGLRIGKLLGPETYGPMGFLVSSSPNLFMAIENYQKLLPSRIPFANLSMSHDEQWISCQLGMKYADDADLYRAAIECISVSLLAIVGSVIGEAMAACQLYCRFPAPVYAERYQTYLPISVQFDAPKSQLLIPKSLAYTANPIANKLNYSMAMSQCQAMLDELNEQGASFSNRVKELLLSGPPGALNELSVAQSLFLSRRTLVRRLGQEQTSLKKIREEIYASIAAQQLMETNTTVESIATLLGYHDSSNFRRAFKRWFNMTPDQYRSRVRGR